MHLSCIFVVDSQHECIYFKPRWSLKSSRVLNHSVVRQDESVIKSKVLRQYLHGTRNEHTFVAMAHEKTSMIVAASNAIAAYRVKAVLQAMDYAWRRLYGLAWDVPAVKTHTFLLDELLDIFLVLFRA
jgi:hypothetical protein